MAASTQFPTVGDDVDVRWDSSSQSYELSFADGAWERLSLLANEHYPSSGAYFMRLDPLPYQYTGRATIHENGWGYEIGQFAFGIPTAAGDVPTSGSATFAAEVWGVGTAPELQDSQYYIVSGDAQLAFDFASGALAGFMDTSLIGPSGSFNAPRYTFTNTVFGVGSTHFSGSFIVPGSSAGSSFSGQFTGPQAAELMAQWQAPFVDTAASTPFWGTMSGVWIGRRTP